MRYLLLLLACLSPVLLGQNAGVQGIVTDQGGAVIPAAQITVINPGTQTRQVVKTNETGFYSVPFLPPGSYRIEVEAKGFATAVRDKLQLNVQQIARVDFSMVLGAVAETVEVTSATALLESEQAVMGQVIENKRIVEMPLNQRNYLELARLTAGVIPGNVLGAGTRPGQTEAGFVAMGQHGYQNEVLLDGVDNSSRASGGALGFQAQAAKPSVDAVGEFKVVTNNFSAEYGFKMGPKVLVSLKSGTNRLHGSLFEFLRNEKFDGSNFFANRSGSKKPTLRQNQFGGTVGGPIIHDRTFFFFSYQGTRIRAGRSLLSTVPSPQAIGGDFSNERPTLNRIFDPLAITGGTGTDAIRQAFPNNTIPASRLDPVSTPIAKLYPAPNVPGNVFGANNYFRAPSEADDANQYDYKIDHNFSTRDRVFFRHSLRRQNIVRPSSLPVEAGGSGGELVAVPADNLAFNWTRSITPTLFNEVRFGYTYFHSLFNTLITEPLNDRYGIKGAPGDRFEDGIRQGFSHFVMGSYNNLGTQCCWPNRNTMDNMHIADNVVLQRGSHTFKAGIDYRRLDLLRNASRFRRGQFSFSKVYTAQQPNVAASRVATGNNLADMLLGLAANISVGNPNGENVVAPYWGGYVQDDWRVNSRLTVNLGLRWDFFQSGYFPGGTSKTFPGVSNFLTEFQGVKRGDPRYETFVKPQNDKDCGCEQDYNNVGPRIGLAYRLSSKTVLRASGGLFFGEADLVTNDSVSFVPNTPEFTEVTLNGNNLDAITRVRDGFPAVQIPATSPVRGAGVITQYLQRDNQYSIQWFADVQRELPGDIVFVVGYQGSGSRKIGVARNINNGGPHPSIPEVQRRIRPQWNSVELRAEPMANTSYNAFLARAEKRFSKGLTFITSYTWSHTIDNATQFLDNNFGSYANMYDLRNERGNSNLDMRHVFTTSGTYELPFGRGRSFGTNWSRAAEAALGGWQLGGILSLRTGLPFDVSYPGDPQNSGTRNRGDRVGSGVLANPTIDRWFDETAFQLSRPGVYGTTGRNVLFGPGGRNFDLILGKRFTMPWEGHTLQFRFEAFNFTNTANFATPASGLRAPTSATINRADEPRRIQFGLKYVF